MTTIIAKNQTAGDLALQQLLATDSIIPASGQVELTVFNTIPEIQADAQLLGYITGDQVLLNRDSTDYTKAQSLFLMTSLGPKNMVSASAPAVTDDANSGYIVGSSWLDTTAQKTYSCMAATVGAADWVAGSGMSPTDHESLNSLVHELAKDNYEEVTRSEGSVTQIVVWTDSGKTTKIRETSVTRDSGQISQIVNIQYNAAGVEIQKLTGVVTRATGQVSHITWTET